MAENGENEMMRRKAELFDAFFTCPEEWLALLRRLRLRAQSSQADGPIYRTAVHVLASSASVNVDAVLAELYARGGDGCKSAP